LSWFHPYDQSNYKYNLSIIRLVHFLGIAFLVNFYVGSQNAALRWGRDCIIETGRWSLQIFAFGAVLSEVGTVAFVIYAPCLLLKNAFNVGAVLLTALVAIVLANCKRRNGATSGTSAIAQSVVL